MANARGKHLPDLAHDRAIEREADDRLNRIPFVENLILALIDERRNTRGRVVSRRSTGLVVGLTGKWGSGKSSILNLVAQRLKKTDHVVVATLNPWLFSGRDELLAAFFNELRDALGHSPKEHTHDIVAALDNYREAITIAGFYAALAADAAGASGLASAGRTALNQVLKLIRKPKNLSPLEERRNLEKKLSDAKIAVVVLIDELDRVEDSEVRAIAQLVKAIGDIQGISYLVAYDPQRVADALGRGSDETRRTSGEAYLEKIIQHPIPLRPLFSHDVETLFNALLEHHDLRLPTDISDEEMKVINYIHQSITTPRELKRLIGSYVVIERMLRKEVSTADILGYCWILTKSPTLRDRIAENIDTIVDDPIASEISKRVIQKMNKEEKIKTSDVFGEDFHDHEKILRILFPIFGENRLHQSFSRISKRRNLIRTLYLGDPPGIANSDDVKNLWNEPDKDTLYTELKRLLKTGGLRPIIDRLDDLLPQLPKDGDEKFWRALAKACIRDADWLLSPEDNGALAEDAAEYLFRLAARDKTHTPRVKRIIEALLKDDDLIILPNILRKHLFKWGLTIQSSFERSGYAILSQTETEELLNKIDPLIRSELLSGRILKRTPNFEAIYTLTNTNRWTGDLGSGLIAKRAL